MPTWRSISSTWITPFGGLKASATRLRFFSGPPCGWKETPLAKHAFAAMVLSLGAVMPALAERLIFEGSFSSYTECGITGRHECSEGLPVDVPFRFTVDVPAGVVNRPNVRLEESTTYAAPFLRTVDRDERHHTVGRRLFGPD